MSEAELLNKFKDAIIGMNMEEAKQACKNALSQGVSPYKIINEGITGALISVGEKFEAEEYFLAELIMAGEIIKESMKILDPCIKGATKKKQLGKIVIGTGKGDLHDIGKNVVKTFLEGEGFDIIDLGVDVSPEKFIEAIRNEKPKIIALSALMSTTMLEIKNVMKALENAKLRDKVKVIIGGAPITQEFVDDVGADAYAKNAINGVKICRSWVQE